MDLKLIAALGNNQHQYENTRHNIGFTWIDLLASQYQLTWHTNTHGQGAITKLQGKAHTIILFKPGKLMNINGLPIYQCMSYYKVSPSEVMLVYDDLDLAAGIIKLKKSSGHGGHNGVRDCQQYTNIQEMYRLKIGIGRPLFKAQTSNYVLQKPSPEEAMLISQNMTHSIQHIDLLFENKISKYQEKLALYNKQENENGV